MKDIASRAGDGAVLLDIAGPELTEADRRRVRHPLTGGVILFARHWQGREQLAALTAELRALRPDLLICVDQEGGRVQRFRGDGMTALPAMARLGDLARAQGLAAAADAATATGLVLASELRACGVDFSFAPVLDLDPGSRCPAIGTRSFGEDAQTVALLARALIQGLNQAGLASCGKHFPGHGRVQLDSHVAVPIDDRALDDLLADDASPYGWLRTALDSVMPAHVRYPQVDARPAGFSRVWLQDILRGRLGFHGLIFSDDLSMEAARRVDDVQGGALLPYADAALLALQAGCDMAVVCNQSIGDSTALDDLLDGLSQARDSGAWQPDPLSRERRLRLLARGPALVWDALQRESRYVAARDLLATRMAELAEQEKSPC
ncbi:beta-N-acetylhexosaminidase [Amphibiibacter pelophylacis]|uniref:Beta-N-acetylhexosaminidase n=1 Tax=Amphibiibacter pelophylacis TaxID=1799477 RepID=A0ACC6NZL6_9BURK